MRHLRRAAATIGLLTVGALALAGTAGAASPNYSGSTTTTASTTTTTSSNLNTGAGNGTSSTLSFTVAVGQSFTGQACGFAPGTTVTFTLVGTPAATTTAASDGCATFTAHATDPHLSINGGTLVAVSFGANPMLATGTGPSGTPNTVNITANVVPASSAAPSSSSSGLAFTGADILAMVVGGLALIALGFLVLTFVRRRRVTAS